MLNCLLVRYADLAAQLSDYSRARSTRAPRQSVTLAAQSVTPAAPAAAEDSTPTEAPKKQKVKPPLLLNALTLATLTQEQQAQRDQMLALARELGWVCQPRQGLAMDLGQQLFARMTNRQGKAICQCIDFNLSFPREAALQLFPSRLQEEAGESTIQWTSDTLQDAAELLGDLLSMVSPTASGLTRAICPPSESVIRVWSTMLPTIEVKSVIMSHGAERLYYRGTYVLWDDSAGMHPPKDSQRREIAFSAGLEDQLRARVLQDVLTISANQRCNPSANWWRQLGREDTAAEVEAGLVTHWQRGRAARVQQARQARLQALPLAARRFDVSRILAEQQSTGAAKCYYLVEWAGYDPSWEEWRISGEPGTPLVTWEPLRNVRMTDAFCSWKQAQAQNEAVLTAPAVAALLP